MRRSAALILLLLACAFPSFGRVLSYAPYTDRPAFPAIQERTSRYFALVESEPGPNSFEESRIVLYDTQGDEPRVVYPKSGTAAIIGVAVREVSASAVPPFDPPVPMLLAAIVDSTGYKTIISVDAGETWKEVMALRGLAISARNEDPDFGGPWVQGLYGPIRLGPINKPFIVSAHTGGVYVISTNGTAEILRPDAEGVIGQNADGSRILILDRVESSASHATTVDLHVADMYSGRTTRIATGWASNTGYRGWIAPDGSVYVLARRPAGNMLYLIRNGNAEFIAGPRGVAAQPPESTGGNYHDALRFFAVPTADFSGAWIIQRSPGQPTTLLRHRIGSSLETMWSDPAGPEVEALIAGRSGETLLVQVHRDRTEQLQRPFVDPALAIWRVGESMPRGYDELYMNEEFDKGFVNVDVDAMASGAPFVFYSGSVPVPDQGPISPPPPAGGGGDVIQEWGVVRASLRQRLVLPGVARAAGAFGSLWRTDVTIYNPEAAPQQVEVRYIGMREVAATATRRVTLTLQAGEIRFLPDVLQSVFGMNEGGGALYLVPTTAINAFGRTYTRSGAGTYGFGMLAIDEFNASGPRFPLTFAGAFPGDQFRTNILITDTSGRGTAATMNAYGVTGAIGTSAQSIFAPAGGINQFNGLGPMLNLLPRESGALRVQPTSGTAIVTVVAMDNRTNDPTYFPPDLPSDGLVRTIPVIGHVAGAHGAQFRSDLYLLNPADETRTVVLEARGWDGLFQATKQFTLLPHEARMIPDAMMTLFQKEGVARLRYWTQELAGEGVRLTSRTYTVDETGATYGSLIPPFNNFQLGVSGDALEILGATAGPGFRTNIGLVELSPNGGMPGASTQVRIRLFDEQHRQVDTFTVSVARGGGMQINDVFVSRGLAVPAAALIRVEVLDAGLIGAYGTVTDNVTNDTSYVAANLAAQTN